MNSADRREVKLRSPSKTRPKPGCKMELSCVVLMMTDRGPDYLMGNVLVPYSLISDSSLNKGMMEIGP